MEPGLPSPCHPTFLSEHGHGKPAVGAAGALLCRLAAGFGASSEHVHGNACQRCQTGGEALAAFQPLGNVEAQMECTGVSGECLCDISHPLHEQTSDNLRAHTLHYGCVSKSSPD